MFGHVFHLKKYCNFVSGEKNSENFDFEKLIFEKFSKTSKISWT